MCLLSFLDELKPNDSDLAFIDDASVEEVNNFPHDLYNEQKNEEINEEIESIRGSFLINELFLISIKKK